MMFTKLLSVGCPIVMAAALMSQPVFATGLGCKINAVWTDTSSTGQPRTLSRSCSDLSASGSSAFNGVDPGGATKSYHMVVNLKKLTGSGNDVATIFMLSANGTQQTGVSDTNPSSGSLASTNGPVGVSITITTMQLLAGDNAGS